MKHIKIRAIFVSCFLLFLFCFLFINLGVWLSAPASEAMKCDLIVSLGGDSGERGQMAFKLYKMGFAKHILLTGMGGNLKTGQTFYDNPRTSFLIGKGVPTSLLLFDAQASSTYEEAISIATLMQFNHWRNALIVSDPPHMRRLDYVLKDYFEKNGLQYRLIQSQSLTWQALEWWHDPRWRTFCLMELVKLIYYALVYHY